MTIQISISGPLLSGKTSLINSIKKKYASQIEIVEDIPRNAIELLGNDFCAKDITAFQNYIGFRQLIEENAELKAGKSFRLLDKSLIDCVAYWNVLVGKKQPVWVDFLSSTRYRLVIICDYRDIEPYADSIRRSHMKYRNVLSDEIDRISSRYGWPVLYASGDLDQRMKVVTSELEKILIGKE